MAYRYITNRDHPLSTPSGRLGEHRVVLYDKIGPGPHLCHHCGRTVEWMPGRHTRKGALVVDHLDGDTMNNDPHNLVPSCHPCNAIARSGRGIQEGELFITLRSGKRVRAERRFCERCGDPFLHRMAAKRPHEGRFCTRSCARKKG